MLERKIESFDRTKIAVNHFKKQGRDSVLVICHGFSMSKDAGPFFALSEDLFELYDVIAMDQRGHGRSEGKFSFLSKEHEDIKSVIDYAQTSYRYIYLMGFSLGAASCIIELAGNKNARGLIVVSAPVSFRKVENRFMKKEALIPGIQKFGPHTLRLRLGNIFVPKPRPIDVVGNIAPIPILFIQGERDPIVYKWHAEHLFAQAGEPKRLEIIKGGLHAEELYRQDPRGFVSLCRLWLKEIEAYSRKNRR